MFTTRLSRSLVVWPITMAVALLGVALMQHQSRGLSPAEEADAHLDSSAVGALGASVTQTTERPNVVVVMADDMRADDLRFMPRVQRLLMAKGLTYRNSFSPFPLCCPARTGRRTRPP